MFFYIILSITALLGQQSIYIMQTYKNSRVFHYIFYLVVIIFFFRAIKKSSKTEVSKTIFFGLVLRILNIIATSHVLYFIVVKKIVNKKKMYFIFYKVVAFICFIGLITYILKICNFNFNFEIIGSIGLKAKNGVRYLKGFLVVFLEGLNRFQSFFDEPGVLGTLLGLLFIFDNDFKVLKGERLIILVSGILTMSTAFYIFFILKLLFFIDYRKTINSFMYGIMIIFFLAVSTKYIQDKYPLIYRNTFYKLINIKNNNREDSIAKKKMNEFFKTSKVWLGTGNNFYDDYPGLDISSWRIPVYKNGIIRFIILIYIILLLTKFFQRKTRTKLSILIFIMSIYQRPELVSLANTIILICGIEYFEDNLEDRKFTDKISNEDKFKTIKIAMKVNLKQYLEERKAINKISNEDKFKIIK